MQTLSDINRKKWEERQQKFEALYKPEGRYKVALSRLALHEPATCLDVGAGNGYLAMLLKELLPKTIVTGVDFVGEVMEAATALDKKVVTNLDEGPLPLADNSFDYITCLEVLEHLILPDHALQEMYRVLKPGGHVLISVPNLQFIEYPIAFFKGKVPAPAADPRHLSVFTLKFLKQKLANAGFSPVYSTGCDASPPWLAKVSYRFLCKNIIVESRK